MKKTRTTKKERSKASAKSKMRKAKRTGLLRTKGPYVASDVPNVSIDAGTTVDDMVRACRDMRAETLSFVGCKGDEALFAVYIVDGKRTRQIAEAFDRVISDLDKAELDAMTDDEKRDLLGELAFEPKASDPEATNDLVDDLRAKCPSCQSPCDGARCECPESCIESDARSETTDATCPHDDDPHDGPGPCVDCAFRDPNIERSELEIRSLRGE